MTAEPPQSSRSLRHYRTGDSDLDAAVEELALATGRPDDLDLIAELLVSSVRLSKEDVDRLTFPENLPDDAMMIPVNMQGVEQDFEDVEARPLP